MTSLRNVIYDNSIFVFVGLDVLMIRSGLRFGKKCIRSELSWYFFISNIVLQISPFILRCLLLLMKKYYLKNFCTTFVDTISFFPVIIFIVDSFYILMYLWRINCLFMQIDVFELNSFIQLVQIYWIIILHYCCKRILWTRILFIFG